MLRINKFLLYLELETAGIVLGWLSAVVFGLAYITLAGVAFFGWFLGGVIHPKDSLIHQLVIMLQIHWFYFVYLFYCFAMTVAGIQLIRGTKTRNHQHTKMFLIMIAVGVVATSIFITPYISSVWMAIIVISLVVIIHVYSFISIYSLHHRFKTATNYEILE